MCVVVGAKSILLRQGGSIDPSTKRTTALTEHAGRIDI
jgi:hypothetical protein